MLQVSAVRKRNKSDQQHNKFIIVVSILLVGFFFSYLHIYVLVFNPAMSKSLIPSCLEKDGCLKLQGNLPKKKEGRRGILLISASVAEH